MIIQFTRDGKTATYKEEVPFVRRDVGVVIPDDGYRYFMAGHEMPTFGSTRHKDNNTDEAIPAVVSNDTDRNWGIRTLAKPNGDYYPINDAWQQWFFDFWDWASGYRLPMGKKIGEYVNPMNPKIVYTSYTPGSKLALYAGMIMDAKSHTDSHSPETGARDVITGRNLQASNPWAWLCRPTSGALFRATVNGSDLRVEAIDLLKIPPEIESLPMHLFYFGTQVHVDGRVTRYPDVKNAFELLGLPPAGTAMPLVAPGGYFLVKKDACVEMKPGMVWKPYYP